jgi:hypothetical protein
MTQSGEEDGALTCILASTKVSKWHTILWEDNIFLKTEGRIESKDKK